LPAVIARVSRCGGLVLERGGELLGRGEPGVVDRLELVGRGDDLRLERAERTEQLALLLVGDVELVERAGQVLDQGVELVVDQVHAGVRGRHVAAGVLAGAAGGLADELDEQALEVLGVGVEEPLLDPRVGGGAADELLDDGGDRRLAAEAVEQAPGRGRLGPGGLLRGRRRGLGWHVLILRPPAAGHGQADR